MSYRPFRHTHALAILKNFDSDLGPLDGYMHQYFRNNKALGSKDRREVSSIVYGVTRWRSLVDALVGVDGTWEEKLECYLDLDPSKYRGDPDLPLHVRVSVPESFLSLLIDTYGEKEAEAIAFACNEEAPTSIRTNAMKGTREELLALLSEDFDVSLSTEAPQGIRFSQREPLFAHPLFKAGWFEIQDEGSQLLSELVAAKPGDHVLDYCAGGGGKSLAIAPLLQGKGQIYLYDIRQHALLDAKKRMKRAGVQNVQYLDERGLRRVRHRMDWVLVDAPCSGTGTLRRNPDMKWRFSDSYLAEFVNLQREVMAQAVRYLKDSGQIVYATCSILPQENQEQIAYFERELGLKAVGEPFISLPTSGGPDGFFAQRMAKR